MDQYHGMPAGHFSADDERRRARTARDEFRGRQPGGAGVNYDDRRGDERYVGGGPRGGQNWSQDGYGAHQSYSAGHGYAAGDGYGGGDRGSSGEYAVSPRDLGVQDYDLQGSYGQPAYGQQPRRVPRSYQRSDERIREDIYERIIARTYIDAGDVSVDVADGVVTLSGEVPDRRMKHEIEDIAVACSCVKEVHNRLRAGRVERTDR